MNALAFVYIDLGNGHLLGGKIVRNKAMGFYIPKIILKILQGHFIKHKPLISTYIILLLAKTNCLKNLHFCSFYTCRTYK